MGSLKKRSSGYRDVNLNYPYENKPSYIPDLKITTDEQPTAVILKSTFENDSQMILQNNQCSQNLRNEERYKSLRQSGQKSSGNAPSKLTKNNLNQTSNESFMGANTSKDEHSYSINNNILTEVSVVEKFDEQLKSPGNTRIKNLVSPRYHDGVITPKTLMSRSVYPSLTSPVAPKSALVTQIPSISKSKRQSAVKETSQIVLVLPKFQIKSSGDSQDHDNKNMSFMHTFSPRYFDKKGGFRMNKSNVERFGVSSIYKDKLAQLNNYSNRNGSNLNESNLDQAILKQSKYAKNGQAVLQFSYKKPIDKEFMHDHAKMYKNIIKRKDSIATLKEVLRAKSLID